MHHRSRYPSDVTDRQWSRIAPLIRTRHRTGRKRSIDLRDVVDGIRYRQTTGCVWRMLPHDFPAWATVYTYARHWQRTGTLAQIERILNRPRRTHSERS